MENEEPLVLRATVERTKKKQKNLLNWIETLIEENRPLREDERMGFLSLVTDACLGEGTKLEATSRHLDNLDGVDWKVDGEGSSVDIETYADFLRYAIYEDRKEVGGQPISKMWKKVRACALKIFPYALQVAVRSSAERIPREETKVHKYGTRSE